MPSDVSISVTGIVMGLVPSYFSHTAYYSVAGGAEAVFGTIKCIRKYAMPSNADL